MTSESHSTLPSLRSSTDRRRTRNRHGSPDETRHRRRRKSTLKEDGAPVYVYRDSAERSRPSRTSRTERRDDLETSESNDEDAIEQESRTDSRTRRVRVVYMTEEEAKAERRRERRANKEVEGIEKSRSPKVSSRSSRGDHGRRKSVVESVVAPSLKRSSTSRDLPSEPRPSLRRSQTTTTHTFTKLNEPSQSGTATSKRSSFIGSFFSPPAKPVKHHQEPEKLVECLTCLSDDIPRSKSAKLKCGHRMCHSCLRRIFRLSVNDPQHMPPKCCTADHIPLKHVERLFDTNFKKNWNRKFQEFSTKNRIYCPARRCGEWIKPGNIHKEDGRKFGKCGRCRTKVCCLCNGKWHGLKDCPKDEETNRLLAAAKDAGWQRCYNCRTMVELKEGCNHMTCRCTAEFCMICGLKWKSCNCPWFNYDAVEADRLNHMQIPAAAERPPQEQPARLRRPRPPNNYHQEINERRRQERMDEELARRLQRAAINDPDDDYQGGIGDIHGVGNGAGHFMNQDYVRAAHNILTGTFDQASAAANYVMGVREARGGPPIERRMSGRYPAPPPPPALRRHSVREQGYNAATRPSERVVPRRTRTDYESEAAVHAPRARDNSVDGARTSVLAGLGGRGSNRVNAWRTHVEPGVTPAEGLLSI